MKDYGQEKRYRDAIHLKSLFGSLPIKKIQFNQLYGKKESVDE